MKAIFEGKRISGLLSVVPETIVAFEDEIDNYRFPVKQTLRLQKVMGFKQHRIVKESTSCSDLCCAGFSHLLNNGLICKEDVGGIVVATSYPDHFIPPVSSIIHGVFGFDEEVICVDVSQGCVAFLWGLLEAFMLLERMPNKKVLVFASDVLSKKTSKQDRNSYPLIGDACGIAVVENGSSGEDCFMMMRNRGDVAGVLQIPAGGSRMPCTPETAVMRDAEGDGNFRSLDNLTMDGSEVFAFVQTEVPPLVEDVLSYAGVDKEEIDHFFFHQPNKFMLKKLAEKLGVPYEKMPMNLVEEFGNSSGACIPLSITYNFADEMKARESLCCLSAFGSGLTWGAMVMKLGKLDFCELLEADL